VQDSSRLVRWRQQCSEEGLADRMFKTSIFDFAAVPSAKMAGAWSRVRYRTYNVSGLERLCARRAPKLTQISPMINKSPIAKVLDTRFISRAIPAVLFCCGMVYAQVAQKQQTDPAVQRAYLEGLTTWRTADSAGNACVFCHSPDGIELAAYNFDDANLRRRALPHLGEKGADQIVQFIHAVREKYGLTKLLDPETDRPLQPGGVVLAGETEQQRDYAFSKELSDRLPLLFEGSIDSAAKAQQAKEQLLALNARQLQVGIPFNRISEDSFHGKEHATFAHWIADTALEVHFPWEVYFSIHDAYLENPSDAEFNRLVHFPDHAQRLYKLSQQMTNSKYRALMILTQDLRLRAAGKPGLATAGPVMLAGLGTKGALPNPMLELGALATERAATPLSEFIFPDPILQKKTAGPDASTQIKQIRLPSLYEGWLVDQGLQRSATCPDPKATKLVINSLLNDGPYPAHAAFVITKKMLTEGFVPEAWNQPTPQHFVIDYSTFLSDGNLTKFEPKDAAAKGLYRKFVANSFLMSLYLYQEQLTKDPTQYPGDRSLDQIPAMQIFLKEVEPSSAGKVQELVSSITKKFNEAKPYSK
jgi:hypothetical protein